MTDISILCVTNRIKWSPWLSYQIKKQILYLKEKSLTYEIFIITSSEEVSLYFKNLKSSNMALYFRLKILKVSEYSDIGTLRNTAANSANGKFLAFMDDDDWYPKYRLHFQWSWLMTNGPKNNVFCHTVDILLCHNLLTKETFWCSGASESCLMFTKEYFEESNGFSGKTSEATSFIGNNKLGIEEDVELIIALTHGQGHLFERSANKDQSSYICQNFENIKVGPNKESMNFQPFDDFEQDFIQNNFGNNFENFVNLDNINLLL